ncbi:hypothetical protein C4D60_Mb04t17070 [Musa balbisiana]|uniref:RING-type domain-containing protein n=1 Tax=Musa balbisiana TaxID=52838 RepID=A0A4S8KCR7_MUSBA|nr:hypothetical protein C4D60_Mb04t17070 [Musa balbisiana]
MGMGLSKYEAVPKTALFAFLLLCLLVGSAGGNLVLIGRNVSLTFPDVEANFAPSVKGSGENGVLYVAEPPDACAPLTNEVAQGLDSRFALILRGGCTFDVKVRSAQNAGFKAAIVYDNEDRGSLISKFRGMSSQLVKAMPSLIFTSVVDDNCTSTTCAICLEDYNVGEKLRLLPCRHKFHAFCVDFWLTTWRSFCPVCKQDARAGIPNIPASEYTPLLSSGAATPSSNAGLSSFRSSMASSPAIQISPQRSQSNCQPHSFSSARSPATQIATMTPHSQSSSFSSACIANPQSSYGHSPAFRIGRSSLDPRNASSHRPQTYLLSSHSLEFPGSSSINSGFSSSYILGSSYVSPSNLAASSS